MIIEDSLNSPLPPTWPMARLKHVALVRYGKALATDNRATKGKVPVYGSSMTTGLHDVAFHDKPSIVIGRKGSVGSVQYVDVPFWPIDTVFFLDDVSPLVDLRFLAAALGHFGLDRYKIVVGVPGLNRDDLSNFVFPLPPLSEQQRIVEILQEAEAIRCLRAEAETKTADLIPAIFADTFGDLYFGKSPFPVQPLSSIGVLDRGKSKHRPRDEPSLYGGAYPFLQTGDVAQANGWITSFSQTYSEKGLEQSRLWPKGTLVITIAANIGSTAILTFDACFPDSVVGFTPNIGISVEYVRWWLLGYQKKLEIQAPQGAQKNINLEVLRSIKIPVPPSDLQSRFKTAIQNLREQLDATAASAKCLTVLSASLSAHAFSGQITAEWREAHQEMLALEAHDRDTILKECGATLSRSRRGTIQEMEAISQDRTDGIYSDLNREQRYVLREINRMVGGVPYARYFSAKQLGDYVSDGPLRRNAQVIEGHLAVLAARGLIIPLSREEQTEDTAKFVFGNTYRLPLKDKQDLLGDEQGNRIVDKTGEGIIVDQVIGDSARLRELERLAAQLEKERALK